jgi:hypothetical protein
MIFSGQPVSLAGCCEACVYGTATKHHPECNLSTTVYDRLPQSANAAKLQPANDSSEKRQNKEQEMVIQ